MSFNFIPTAFFNSLAVKSTDFLKLSVMEKVKVREQGKEGENDNEITLKMKISPLINQNG